MVCSLTTSDYKTVFIKIIQNAAFAWRCIQRFISVANLTGLRITMETYHYVCSWGCSQKTVIEEDLKTVSITTPWAGVLERTQLRQAEHWQPSASVPDCRHNVASTFSLCTALSLPRWTISWRALSQNKPVFPEATSCQVLCHRTHKGNLHEVFLPQSYSEGYL